MGGSVLFYRQKQGIFRRKKENLVENLMNNPRIYVTYSYKGHLERDRLNCWKEPPNNEMATAGYSCHRKEIPFKGMRFLKLMNE
jgi:hypothetical protein